MDRDAAFPAGFYPWPGTGREIERTQAPARPGVQESAARQPCGGSHPACQDDVLAVERVRAGDEEAALALVHRLYPTIIRSVRCHLPRQASEEDLAQVVYAKVFSKLHQYSGLVPLEHWVSRITVNTCLSQLNREKGRPELRMSDLSEADQAIVECLRCSDLELPGDWSRDARELVDKLLGALPPDDRLVITLLHLEEKSTEEISRLTGWSVSRVKVKAFRARNKMRLIWHKLTRTRDAN